MNLAIAGLGWVTPLGSGLEEVWARLMSGERAAAKELLNPETNRLHHYAAIPPKLVEHLARQPRLRRASPISYYAVGAGLAAFEQAGISITPAVAARTAVLFAVSSGSVVYTRRFFEGVVKQGAGAASPMLFPETVYNAPSSHLAAQLGVEGYSYTLVGDSSVALGAVKLAEQLLESEAVDFCLVVGAEEIDWVLCEAYRDWRFAGGQGLSLPYARRPTGALLAEGAGAVLLTRLGEIKNGPGLVITDIHDGISYSNRAEMTVATREVAQQLLGRSGVDGVVGSANGSWGDRAEAAALKDHLAPLCCPKVALGEALGAGALWQIIVAALALEKGEFPVCSVAGELAPPGSGPAWQSNAAWQTALVLCTGVNQQASGLTMRRED